MSEITRAWRRFLQTALSPPFHIKAGRINTFLIAEMCRSAGSLSCSRKAAKLMVKYSRPSDWSSLNRRSKSLLVQKYGYWVAYYRYISGDFDFFKSKEFHFILRHTNDELINVRQFIEVKILNSKINLLNLNYDEAERNIDSAIAALIGITTKVNDPTGFSTHRLFIARSIVEITEQLLEMGHSLRAQKMAIVSDQFILENIGRKNRRLCAIYDLKGEDSFPYKEI